MANRNATFYNALDLRRYVSPGDFGVILDYANSKYNGLGWQQYGQFGPKQYSRNWGNIIKNDEIFVKASLLSVGAPKPQRSTSGWERYGGSIPKIGHGLSIDEDDLLTMQELKAYSDLQQPMLDQLLVTSQKLIGGIHNKLTSWTYEALSTGYIHELDVDGTKVDIDMKIDGKHKVTVGVSWFQGDGTANTASDPVQDLIDAQKIADETNMPYDHWEVSKALYRKFINHPSVIAKCRNRMTNVVNTGYILVENEILSICHDFGIRPFKVVDEKSSVEIDGIAQIDAASFDQEAFVLCSLGSIFEVKNARSVYEERVAAGPQQTAMYAFVNDRIAVMDMWQESPVKNIFECELWAVPVLRNPKNLLILNVNSTHQFK